jgi:dihydroorotate dehydrogenase (fumarate)
MDLSTQYLGLKLSNPLMPGASPLVDDLDAVRRLEDAGAAAIVMHSLFEEQLTSDQMSANALREKSSAISPEASTYLPEPPEYRLGPEEYLDQLRKIKAAVRIPVIASLNGSTPGGWLNYAKLMEQAGADALELNVYYLPTDTEVSSERVEQNTIDILGQVKKAVGIPVCVKLSPFYSSLAHFAKRLDAAGADGIVLFNRFYQPDIDVEELEVVRTLHLSDSSELLLRLRWLAILSGRVPTSLAVSGGVHTSIDAIKAVMTGAHAVQVVSAVLKNGPAHLKTMRDEMAAWLEKREYESLKQMQGSMNLVKCPDPKAYERANYIKILMEWKG